MRDLFFLLFITGMDPNIAAASVKEVPGKEALTQELRQRLLQTGVATRRQHGWAARAAKRLKSDLPDLPLSCSAVESALHALIKRYDRLPMPATTGMLLNVDDAECPHRQEPLSHCHLMLQHHHP